MEMSADDLLGPNSGRRLLVGGSYRSHKVIPSFTTGGTDIVCNTLLLLWKLNNYLLHDTKYIFDFYVLFFLYMTKIFFMHIK